MHNRSIGSVAAMVAVIVIVPVTLALAAQQTGGKAQAAATSPDLSGVWFQREGSGVGSYGKDPVPMQPWVAEKSKTLRHDVDDPDLRCLPPGVPRVLLSPTPMEIITTPRRILILHENDHLFRQIWMDGRKHPDDLEPTWMGHSVGHWDKDTLVIDTVGLTDKSWLDNEAHLHTDALHVVERYRRLDHDTLQVSITIEDPKAYTKPWGGQRVFKLHPDWQITEQICEDNIDYNKSLKEGK